MPLRSNYFVIELHHRKQLQFVREISDLFKLSLFFVSHTLIQDQIPDFNKLTCDGEIRIFFCYVSGGRHELGRFTYPHKSEITIKGNRLTGFDVLKQIIMAL